MRHQKIPQAGKFSSQCSTTSHGDQKIMKKDPSQMPISFLSLQQDFKQDNGLHFVFVQRKRVISWIVEGKNDDNMVEKVMLEFA